MSECEVVSEFLNTYCERCFSHGEEAYRAGILRKDAIVWVCKNKHTPIFCGSCVVAGWNHAEEIAEDEREENG